MSVFWRDVKRGQNLYIDDVEGKEEVIGGYRENKLGIEAYARTFGYEPERSRKGFDSVEAAKLFVESFCPWEIFGVRDATVALESRSKLD